MPFTASDFSLRFDPLARASLNRRVVSGVIPGGYPNAALASNIAVNDVITAVDGVSVTDESLMTQIKKARDVVGGKVKLQLGVLQ